MSPVVSDYDPETEAHWASPSYALVEATLVILVENVLRVIIIVFRTCEA